MQMMNKKNSCFYIPGKKALLFYFLLFPALVRAQTDTAFLADSLPTEIREAPADDPPQDEVTIEDKETGYFLKTGHAPGDSSLLQRHVPDSLVNKMQQDDDFWYANAEIKEEKPEDKKSDYIPLGQQQWFQTLLWLVIVAGFAAVIIWYLAGNKVGLFRRKNKAIQTTGEEELSTEDIFAINYQKEIDKAETIGNYRLAIRLMFLRLLKDMAEKNIIQYKQDRTNLDYLLQLHPTVYYNNFFRITRNYEYSWYGQFEVGKDAFRMIRNDFNQLDRQLQ